MLPNIASVFHLLPKDLHITWYLRKSSNDIYHTTKKIQEEAQSFISSKNSKPIATLAILKCAAQAIIQAIGPHEKFLSSLEHNYYHIQVIAMENYLDHQAPVYQGPPLQDPDTCTGARTKGPPPSPGPDYAPHGFMGDWHGFIPALISKSHHLLVHWFQKVPNIDQYQALILNIIHEDEPTTIIDYNIQGTWDTKEEELEFENDQASFECIRLILPTDPCIHDIEPCWIQG